MSAQRMASHKLLIKVGNDYIDAYLIGAKKRLVGCFYTQKQIDDIMDPLESEDSRATGIYVSTSNRTLYKFSTVPRLSLNLIELLGIAENTKD